MDMLLLLFLRHTTRLVLFFSAKGTFAQFRFEHRIIGGATASEFLASDQVAYVDE
jgi:hypothetical protein